MQTPSREEKIECTCDGLPRNSCPLHAKEWEEKIIERISFEYIDCDLKDIIRQESKWLLGGENFEWEYKVDKVFDRIILRRK